MENKFLVDKYKDKVTVLENGSVIADVELWDEMSKLIKKNKFDFEDFLNQINQLNKIGSIKDLVKYMPGGNKIKNLN